ncbi:hypothetical protein [Acutalibacter sp.]|jgi:hypothetical protein|uniref:hypothetical protein n=1 Tax=Acutalibacter sp. TaxID=1918636 RepID=UPI00217002F9|nr:hypothetical protein [Acutalibacter sp.]
MTKEQASETAYRQLVLELGTGPEAFARPDGKELALLEKLADLRRADIETSKNGFEKE